MGGRGSGGHNRKSAARKKLEGNAGKRKSSKQSSQPRYVSRNSGPLGSAPAHLKDEQKKVWDELSSIVPAGAVEASDRWAFELLVCLMSKFRRGYAKAGEVNQISSQLARFGMTPADRGRVSQSRPLMSPTDPFAKFNLPAQPRQSQ
jgi:hypothetical protein